MNMLCYAFSFPSYHLFDKPCNATYSYMFSANRPYFRMVESSIIVQRKLTGVDMFHSGEMQANISRNLGIAEFFYEVG